MWVIPNDNPEGRAFFALTTVFAVIALFAFGLRVYSRRLHKASFDASDYCCFVGLLLDILLVVIIFGVFSHGWGQDISKFTLEDGYFAAAIFILIEICWNAASVAVRASMLLLYIRIFPSRRFRIICWIALTLFIGILVSVIFTTFLICKPLTYSFVPITPGGHCGNLAAFELYTAISSLISDFIVVVLPMPLLWKLQMSNSKKLGLAVVFGMGTIICILTLIRVFISQFYDLNNYTKQSAIVGLITALEPIIGVINVCLPFLPLVFSHIGKSHIFSRVPTFMGRRSTVITTDKPDPRANGIRADSADQFDQLDNYYLKSYGKVHATTSKGGKYAHRPSDDECEMLNGAPAIMVRKDLSVESNMV